MLRKSLIVIVSVVCLAGCTHPDAGHGDLKDYVFGRRHRDVFQGGQHEPMLDFAHEITLLEDDLRRDGTITIKQPDVWGDANLVHFIQEYDREMTGTVDEFQNSLQAYLARSDQAEFSATQSLSEGLGGAQRPTATTNILDLEDITPFSLITSAKPPSNLSIEPTESERQHSTYILVNQALRRRNMGDDNSQAAGYGLYKFRIPVSILPGRETDRNHAAVVTLRAQLQVDEANLRYMYPKLVVADIVDALAEPILVKWNKPTGNNAAQIMEETKASFGELYSLVNEIAEREDKAESLKTFASGVRTGTFGDAWARLEAQLNEGNATAAIPLVNRLLKQTDELAKEQAVSQDPDFHCLREQLKRLQVLLATMQELAPENRATGPQTLAADTPVKAVFVKAYSNRSIDALRAAAQEYFLERHDLSSPPKVQELRAFMFAYLAQVYRVMEDREALVTNAPLIAETSEQFELGFDVTNQQLDWFKAMGCFDKNSDEHLVDVSWLIAVQSGLLDRNLKRILVEMSRSGKLAEEQLAAAEMVHFFAPDCDLPITLQLWSTIIQQEFPLTVFTLDPQVEEQNVFDAFSRRREMQVALAYGVATGTLNATRAMAFSRQLALDMETIALHRTAVGFSHANDTFGWYFYPRVQTPPSESTNIGALARTIWSTGPTEHYDVKHRNLEPGIRECEVIVAMPSFVNRVSFDVTTNWERLTCPGRTKRSYEEMMAQGARVHQLRCAIHEGLDDGCYRPGDYARLISRIDQLEHMLGMQTYVVNVPYHYEQSGTDLFDTGNIHLAPVIQDFYGLTYAKANEDINAHFFLRGKNFHPTLTHVVVGGSESHSMATAKVEVISRELLLVQTDKLNAALSPSIGFEVRVGTPAGLSNPLTIPAKPIPPTPRTPSAFDWARIPLNFEAQLTYNPRAATPVAIDLETRDTELNFKSNIPLPTPNLANGSMVFLVSGIDADGNELFADESSLPLDIMTQTIMISDIEQKITDVLNKDALVTTDRIPAELQVITFLRFDHWPYEEFDTPINIKVHLRK